VSTGNQADIDVVECALAVVDDPGVDVIGLYLESLLDANAYLELLDRALELDKTVVVLKSGQSHAGAQAAISHTAALVGNAAVFEAVSLQHGAMLAHDLEELMDKASGFLTGRVASGKRVGVVSSSGGVGVILADEIERQGLSVATLSPATRARLAVVVPGYGSTNDPVDATATLVARMIGGESGLWTECFSALADDPQVDEIIIGLTMITGEAGVMLADEVISTLDGTRKPILVAWLGADLCRDAFERLRTAGVPMFTSTARAVRAAAALTHRSQHRSRSEGGALQALDLPTLPPHVPGTVLSEWRAQPLLRAAGIRCPWSRLVGDQISKSGLSMELGKRYAVKVQSSDIVHKTDAGAVKLSVEPDHVREAIREVLRNARSALPDARIEGVMVQEMIPAGIEMLVSVVRDPWFGLILTLGMGGTLTELIGDVSLRHLPVGPMEIQEMLAELRGAAVLQGPRGGTAYDVEALVDAVERMSRLALSMDESLEEIEINPLMVLPKGQGVLPADCLVRFQD
jgi:acyl-CoA synthetase (NDP forming)